MTGLKFYTCIPAACRCLTFPLPKSQKKKKKKQRDCCLLAPN